jgi:hypothetical protein
MELLAITHPDLYALIGEQPRPQSNNAWPKESLYSISPR